MISARLRRTSFLLLVVLGLLPTRVDAEPSRRASAPKLPATSPAAPQILARHLCDALQALPEARRAACCATAPTGGLAGECVRVLAGSLRDQAIALDAADVERCVAASTRQLEGCAWVAPYAPRLPDSCRGILHGRRAVGASCRSSLECADGSFCWGSGPATPGVCAPPGAPGTTCGGVVDPLASYARQTDDGRHPECAGLCVKGRCAGVLAPGSACSASAQCGPEGHCAFGHCAAGPRPGLGEACAGTTCGDDLACLDGHCAAPKKAGESCATPFECEASCLPATDGKSRICGMQCSAWPPAGYAPAVTKRPQPRG